MTVIKIGADWVLHGAWVDDDGPVDLTGAELTAALASPLLGRVALSTRTIDAVGGRFEVLADAAVTRALLPGRYELDVAVVRAGEVTPLPPDHCLSVEVIRSPAAGGGA